MVLRFVDALGSFWWLLQSLGGCWSILVAVFVDVRGSWKFAELLGSSFVFLEAIDVYSRFLELLVVPYIGSGPR